MRNNLNKRLPLPTIDKSGKLNLNTTSDISVLFTNFFIRGEAAISVKLAVSLSGSALMNLDLLVNGTIAFLVFASKVAANITSYISSDSDVGLPNFNANASFVDINQPIRFTPESNLHEPKFGITAASSIKPQLAFVLNGKFEKKIGFQIVSSLNNNISFGNKTACLRKTQPRLKTDLNAKKLKDHGYKECVPYCIIEGWTNNNHDIDEFIKDTIYDFDTLHKKGYFHKDFHSGNIDDWSYIQILDYLMNKFQIIKYVKLEFGKGTPKVYKKLAYNCMNATPNQIKEQQQMNHLVYSMFEEANKEIPNMSISYEKDSDAIYHTSRVFTIYQNPLIHHYSNSNEENDKDCQVFQLFDLEVS
ncbi:hypothetical protein RhiirA4_465622 [Rhizophagus irregularis]|uniref:Uncharacterized protein n=1 Tax=Rhizophagus irregularis TaxID=588596 RepID=A0A2I1GM37_9GLOM|nr:hypothetical protein RhiirA4_463003 [Rhizophagus irregularis]PKY49576.1 hypothetical protein RhiirA4_465622 [Rhizophagus irregularis]